MKKFPSRILRAFTVGMMAFFVVFVSAQTTTVTVSNTVQQAALDRPGINLGTTGAYGNGQLLKSLFYADGGYIPGANWESSWQCSTGGNNSTTTWYNSASGGNGQPGGGNLGYPANLFVGATFDARSSTTGASYGTGTITASTANTGSSGITFTLSPAISTVCTPSTSDSDVLIVKLNQPNQLMTPAGVTSAGASICAGATLNFTDTSPASTNSIQSFQMPGGGCSWTLYSDQILANSTNSNSSLAPVQVNYINLNGSYTATFKAKCSSVSGTAAVTFSVNRGGVVYVPSTTETLTCNAASGQG